MSKKQKIGTWTFGNNIYKTFDIHIQRSVPSYLKTHDLICQLSSYFLTENSVCYDLGFSTGNLLRKINNHNYKRNIHYIGVEPEKQMFKSFRDKNKFKKITLINKPIEKIKMKKSDLIISHYTLQFIKHETRFKVLKKIYKSLNPEGGFILFEKIYGNNSRFEKFFSDLLIDFKSKNKFSEKNIVDKNRAIRGILQPLTLNQNFLNLKKAGFSKIQIIHQDLNFIGILSLK